MKKAKISIICLSVLLIVLIIVCAMVLKNSSNKATVAKDNESLRSKEPAEDEQTSPEEGLVSDDSVSVLDQIQKDTNDPLSSDEWSQVLTDMRKAFERDDFEYLGYSEDTDNLYFYKLKGSDIVVSVSTLDGTASIDHYYNSISNDYTVMYFIKGMPEDREKIYKLGLDYNFYLTNYQGGDTLQYWCLNDPDNIMEMKIK